MKGYFIKRLLDMHTRAYSICKKECKSMDFISNTFDIWVNEIMITVWC